MTYRLFEAKPCAARLCCISNRKVQATIFPMSTQHMKHHQNGHHFADSVFRYIFLNENYHISNKFHWSPFLWPSWQSVALIHSGNGGVPKLQWRHNERGSISNHQRLHCLLNCRFRHRSKKHQSSAPVAFVRWPVNSPHKRPLTRKMFPFDDVIMKRWQNIAWTHDNPTYRGINGLPGLNVLISYRFHVVAHVTCIGLNIVVSGWMDFSRSFDSWHCCSAGKSKQDDYFKSTK